MCFFKEDLFERETKRVRQNKQGRAGGERIPSRPLAPSSVKPSVRLDLMTLQSLDPLT